MSTFNADLFLQTSVNEALSTKLTPVPAGEFPAMVKDIKPRALENGSAVIDVTWSIDDAEVAAVTGIKTPTVRQTVWLDLTESGGLDKGQGKNVGLGRLREAVGQNQSGKPWAPSMLVGSVAKIKVTHSVDKNDSEIIYANVSSVAKV